MEGFEQNTSKNSAVCTIDWNSRKTAWPLGRYRLSETVILVMALNWLLGSTLAYQKNSGKISNEVKYIYQWYIYCQKLFHSPQILEERSMCKLKLKLKS